MRFGIEVVEKVREAVGSGYPIIMRLAGNEFMVGGNTNEEARRFAVELEKAGVDLFNVTGGWHETRIPQLTMFVPPKAFTYLAQGIKTAVQVPVLASNRINDPRLGESIIQQGEADLVTMARGLLADPDLPRKALHGESDTIFHCIACNQGCFDSVLRFQPVTCLVNPRAGLEGDIEITRPAQTKKILVIGGGPAGMKAACTAAERGHKVLLVEKENQLGGQLLLNRNIPGRTELVTAARDLISNMKALSVDTTLGKAVDPAWVKDTAPDAVIIATGARPIRPEMAGIEKDHVVQAWDVLSGKARVGKEVAVVGGNAVGLEAALYLAHQGTLSPEVLHFLVANRAESWETLETLVNQGNKTVTVLEMMKKAGQDIGPSTRWTVLSELRRLGVTILTGAQATEITGDGVKIEQEGRGGFLTADTVVMAVGSRPERALADALQDLCPEVIVVGDAKEPRNALEAIKEGFEAGLKV
jgi:2,4-dienoyl-CoA reductase (NADPH2)